MSSPLSNVLHSSGIGTSSFGERHNGAVSNVYSSSQGDENVDMEVEESKQDEFDQTGSSYRRDRDEKERKAKARSHGSHSSDAGTNKSLLSTSSPEGIAAASQVTPNKIATLLLEQGPLPIRHITSHLASQIPGFGNLSLSKQRRLIIAALEMGDTVTQCVFEKIGWGQWEARKASLEEISSRNTASLQNANASGSSAPSKASTSFNNHTHQHGRDSDSSPSNEFDDYPNISSSIPKQLTFDNGTHRKSIETSTKPRSVSPRTSGIYRRESITNSSNDLHGTKVPLSPSLQPLQSLRRSFKDRHLSLDEAIESSSDEELDLDNAIDDDEDELFSFDSDDGGAQHGRKVGRSLSSSFIGSGTQRRSITGAGISKPRKSRSSFSNNNNYSLEAALDESGLDTASIPEGLVTKRRPRVSFSNSSSVTRQSFLRTNLSPNSNPLTIHDSISNLSVNRVSSTDSVNLKIEKPVQQSQPQKSQQTQINVTRNGNNLPKSEKSTNEHCDTDEEDWESIGVNGFRRNMSAYVVTPPTPYSSDHNHGTNEADVPLTVELVKPEPLTDEPTTQDEQLAAMALMGLKSV